jgi:DNA-binding transcriptional ArsR family regulator
MTKYEPHLDQLFTALGDPTRRAILSRLARGPASVTELAGPHAMALPSFLGHLTKLETAGLIATTKEGRVRSCALTPDAFLPAQDWLNQQRAVWEGRLDRLDAYVTTLTKDHDHEA